MRALNKIVRILDGFNPVVKVIFGIGVAVLFLWVCLSFYDVIARFIFNRALSATIQIGSIALLIVIFTSIGYVHHKKSHIRIDLVYTYLSPRGKIANDIGTYIVCAVTLAVMVWQSTTNIFMLMSSGEEVSVLQIPIAPFSAMIPIGCLLYLVMVLRDVFAQIAEGMKQGLQKYQWFLAFFAPVLVLAGLGIFMYSPGMDPAIVGVIALIVMLVITFLGMPVGLCLAFTAFTFMGNIAGADAGFSTVGTMLFRSAGDYSWVAIVFFVLMSYYIVVSDIGGDSYDTAYKWMGHAPGGLAIATIGASGALAAVIGDAAASTITMGKVALPQMKKHKYDDALATGAVQAGATLGPLIPPSVPFIIYGILAEVSIGKLFIAGLIPGLVLMAAFMLWIYIKCRRNPKLGPPGPIASWGERFKSLKLSGPILILFVLVLGGIYFGLFSAVEAGAIGSAMALVIALAMKRINSWQKFFSPLIEAAKMSTAVIFIIVCSMSFGYVVGASSLNTMLVDLILGINASPNVIVAFIVVVYFILGFALNTGVVLILTIPLFAPIMQAMGVDLVWFGVLAIVVGNLGQITPPEGIVLFTMRIIAPEIPMTTLFRGVMPFVWATVVVIVILFFFPPLSTWLPSIMLGK